MDAVERAGESGRLPQLLLLPSLLLRLCFVVALPLSSELSLSLSLPSLALLVVSLLPSPPCNSSDTMSMSAPASLRGASGYVARKFCEVRIA